ncbi:hypothetical protein ACOME3_010815 [Neoechinorhynchus agilis]
MAKTSKLEMKAKDSEDKKQGTNESNVEKSIFPLHEVSPIDTVVYSRRSVPRKCTMCQRLDYTVKRVAHEDADIFKTISWNDYLRAKYGSVEASLVKESLRTRKTNTAKLREMPLGKKEGNERIKNIKEVSLGDGFFSQWSNGDTKEVPVITVTSSEQKDVIQIRSENFLGRCIRTNNTVKNRRVASSDLEYSIRKTDDNSSNKRFDSEITNRSRRVPSTEQSNSVQTIGEKSPSKSIEQQKSPTVRRLNKANGGNSQMLTERTDSVKSIRQESRVKVNKLQMLDRKRQLPLESSETSHEEWELIRSGEEISEKSCDGGALGSSALSLLKDLSKKLREATGDSRAGLFLRQNISLAVQRGNAASVMATVEEGQKLEFDRIKWKENDAVGRKSTIT